MAIVVPYKGELAQRLNAYFVEHVFVAGQGPDFRDWVKEQGGTIRITGHKFKKNFVLEFEDERLFTMFMLKY